MNTINGYEKIKIYTLLLCFELKQYCNISIINVELSVLAIIIS